MTNQFEQKVTEETKFCRTLCSLRLLLCIWLRLPRRPPKTTRMAAKDRKDRKAFSRWVAGIFPVHLCVLFRLIFRSCPNAPSQALRRTSRSWDLRSSPAVRTDFGPTSARPPRSPQPHTRGWPSAHSRHRRTLITLVPPIDHQSVLRFSASFSARSFSMAVRTAASQGRASSLAGS